MVEKMEVMNSQRIKEIQQETAHPESVSVQQALLKGWNETAQEQQCAINDDSHSLFCDELCKWLQEKGFLNNRGWDGKQELGMMFYSFVKGNFRFEMKLNWHKKYDWHEPIIINFIDCEKEWWGEPMNCLMWMGQINLHTFKKPFSRSMFDALCEQYGL